MTSTGSRDLETNLSDPLRDHSFLNLVKSCESCLALLGLKTDLFLSCVPAFLRNRFGAKESPEHIRRGARGEKLACRFLRQNGYKILHRNFKGRTGGEIDLVCRDHDTLVFIEVKTRTSEDFGRPFETIKRQQQWRISRGALAWLRLLDNPEILFRFDVVEVILAENSKPTFELIRNAFQLSAPYIY
jgi:putative endonuclease